MDDRMKRNLTSSEHWIRLLYMVLFSLLLYVVSFVVAAAVVLQFLISLFTGSDNRNVRWFGHGLAVYVQQILMFLTYNSNFKPFPFSDWPEVAPSEEAFISDPDAEPNVAKDGVEPVYTQDTAAAAAAQSYVSQSDVQRADSGLPADAGTVDRSVSKDTGVATSSQSDKSKSPAASAVAPALGRDTGTAEPARGSTEDAAVVALDPDLEFGDSDQPMEPETSLSEEILNNENELGDDLGDLPEQANFDMPARKSLRFEIDDRPELPVEDPLAAPDAGRAPEKKP